MRQAAAGYLALRRVLGYRLAQDGQLLRDFAEHLDAGGARYLTAEAAVARATAPVGVSPYWHWYRLRPIRLFSRYLHTLDPRHELIPEGLLPGQYTRAAPCIFTSGEVIALMRAAGRLSRRLPAATCQALLGMLAVTGCAPVRHTRWTGTTSTWTAAPSPSPAARTTPAVSCPCMRPR
jgi:hypothetical protein